MYRMPVWFGFQRLRGDQLHLHDRMVYHWRMGRRYHYNFTRLHNSTRNHYVYSYYGHACSNWQHRRCNL